MDFLNFYVLYQVFPNIQLNAPEKDDIAHKYCENM